MLGVDDRLVTADTMKWVKVGLGAGLATIPATIVLYYVLGMAVDAAFQTFITFRVGISFGTLQIVWTI